MTLNNSQIQLVVFDWAGTTIDFGSCAPAQAFKSVFSSNGVEVSDEEIRKPMGLNKREHLLSMLGDDSIAASWLEAQGQAWTNADVDAMYRDFMPYQLQALEETSVLIPNVVEVGSTLKAAGIKIGGSTGYFRKAAAIVAEAGAEAGFLLDANCCADDVPTGRPAPWMIYRLMQELDVYPPRAVVKVGDTVADIQAGRNAGCWSIGVCDSSSVNGLSRQQYESLSADQRSERLARTSQTFQQAGSDATIETISQLPALLAELSERIASGALPGVATVPAGDS